MTLAMSTSGLPITPLVVLKNGTGNSSTTVDWTRYKIVVCAFYNAAGDTINVLANGQGFGQYAIGAVPIMYCLAYEDATPGIFGTSFGGGVTSGGAYQPASSALSWTCAAATKYSIYGIAVR